jgi:hypothetical protein
VNTLLPLFASLLQLVSTSRFIKRRFKCHWPNCSIADPFSFMAIRLEHLLILLWDHLDGRNVYFRYC